MTALTLSLNNLFCYFMDEEGQDEVFLKYNKKRIWPVDKKFKPFGIDTSEELNVEIKDLKEGDKVIIELWDFDWLTPNDLLGVFELTIDEISGPFTTDMKQNLQETDHAKYTLEWEVY